MSNTTTMISEKDAEVMAEAVECLKTGTFVDHYVVRNLVSRIERQGADNAALRAQLDAATTSHRADVDAWMSLEKERDALRAALRGLVSAADAVLCDPEGRCVFQGADADRYHVQVYLDAARAALGKEAT